MLFFSFFIVPNLILNNHIILVISTYTFGFLGLLNMMLFTFKDPGFIRDYQRFQINVNID